MSIESEMEMEEQDLCDQLNDGAISTSEYNRQMNNLHREYRSMAEESAQEAYDDEMRRW